MKSATLTGLTLLAAIAACGADDFAARHEAARARNPVGAALVLALASDTPAFRLGEAVELQLRFSSELPGRYVLNGAQYDRSGRQHLETYVVSPASAVEDPLADYYLGGVQLALTGGLRSHPALGAEPIAFSYALNEWVRFDRPGRYRVYATSNRLRDSEEFSNAGPLTSNVVEIEILPRDPAWEAATIEQSVSTLRACDTEKSPFANLGVTMPLPLEKDVAYRSAARTLRFLGTQEAVEAVIGVWGVCAGRFDLEFTLTLVGAADRQYVRRRLDAALLDPSMGVESTDLALMALLEGAEQPDWRIPGLLDPAGPSPDMSDRLAKRRDEHAERLRSLAERLALALPDKKPAVARFSLRAVEAFAPEKARELAYLAREEPPTAASWDELSFPHQMQWLGQEMGPARSRGNAADSASNRRGPASPTGRGTGSGIARQLVWEQAMLRLGELEPSDTESRLVEEVLRPDSLLYAQSRLLDLLPETLPQESGELADRLEENPVRAAYLVARLADDSVYDRVEAVYLRRQHEWPCDTNEMLLGYLLRFRPARGWPMCGRRSVSARSPAASDTCSARWLAATRARNCGRWPKNSSTTPRLATTPPPLSSRRNQESEPTTSESRNPASYHKHSPVPGMRLLLASLLLMVSCSWIPERTARLELEAGQMPPRPPLLGALALASAEASDIEGLKSVQVSFRGETELERYYNGASPHRTANVKSVSKSVLSALIGIAIEQGVIPGVDTPIGPYFERYLRGEDPRKRQITVEDLLTMRSGLERTSGRNYGAWVSSASWVGYALRQPLIDEPGCSVEYSTGSTHLLSAILTQASGESTWSFAQKNLAEPLGFELARWTRDPEGVYFGGNEMGLTPRQMLDFGLLYLRGGRTADGNPGRARAGCRPPASRAGAHRSGRRYGYGWWIRELADREVCYAWGYGGQFIFVIRDLDLVVVTTSSTDPDARRGRNEKIYRLTANLIENIAASDAFPW